MRSAIRGRRGSRRWSAVFAIALAAGFALSGCGGSNIKSSSSSGGSSCTQPMNMAVNPWVGYEASAHVVGYLAQHKLGCTVNYKNLKEEVSWQGFGSGDRVPVHQDRGHLQDGTQAVCTAAAASSTSPTRWPGKCSLSHPATARADAQ